jgi:hypothetical protein
MTNKIEVRASQPHSFHIKYAKIDVCTFRKPGTGYGNADLLGPFCGLGNPLAGKNVVRLRLDGPRGGEKAVAYFTKEQAMELAHALLSMVNQLPIIE